MVQLQYDKLFPDISELVSGKNKKAEARGIKAETENDDFLEGFNYYSNEEKKEKDELSKYLTRDGAALSATKPPSSYTIPSSVTPPPPKDTEEKDEFLEGFNYSDEEKEEKKNVSMITPQEKKPWEISIWQELQSTKDFLASNGSFKGQLEKSGWEKFLDGASYALTAASAIPALDTFTNIA